MKVNKSFISVYRTFKIFNVGFKITCVTFLETRRQLNVLYIQLNQLRTNIKRNRNFFDLTISKNKIRSYSIHHKPSKTDTTIHNSFLHSRSQKFAAN